MSNMSYCRFQNTVQDVRDCVEVLRESNYNGPITLSKDEFTAYKRFIKFCQEVADDAESYEVVEEGTE